ncbi:MAG: zinc ribbon domain-containing protein [Desulfobacterales bacterium]
MPIYEVICTSCRQTSEVLVISKDDRLTCPNCGGHQTEKLISATSSLTGQQGQILPGSKDTACCGNSPMQSGCAGPGSCCGKSG